MNNISTNTIYVRIPGATNPKQSNITGIESNDFLLGKFIYSQSATLTISDKNYDSATGIIYLILEFNDLSAIVDLQEAMKNNSGNIDDGFQIQLGYINGDKFIAIDTYSYIGLTIQIIDVQIFNNTTNCKVTLFCSGTNYTQKFITQDGSLQGQKAIEVSSPNN